MYGMDYLNIEPCFEYFVEDITDSSQLAPKCDEHSDKYKCRK